MPGVINENFFCQNYSEIRSMFLDKGFSNVRIAVEQYGRFVLYVNNIEGGLGKRIALENDILRLCNKNDISANLEYGFLSVAPATALNFDDWILLEAAKSGDLNVVKQAVANGANINAKGISEFFRNFTPMLLAAANNHVQVMAFLLEEQTKRGDLTKEDLLNAQDSKGTTPLHVAAFSRHLEAVRWLLENGASYNIKNGDGKIAEQVAAKAEIAQLIRDFSTPAEITVTTQKSLTALKDCTRVKVYCGSDQELSSPKEAKPLKSFKSNEQQPVDLSKLPSMVINAELDSVKSVIKQYEEEIATSETKDVIAVKIKEFINAPLDSQNQTLLHLLLRKMACQQSSSKQEDVDKGSRLLEILKYLIAKGADLSVKTKENCTPAQSCIDQLPVFTSTREKTSVAQQLEQTITDALQICQAGGAFISEEERRLLQSKGYPTTYEMLNTSLAAELTKPFVDSDIQPKQSCSFFQQQVDAPLPPLIAKPMLGVFERSFDCVVEQFKGLDEKKQRLLNACLYDDIAPDENLVVTMQNIQKFAYYVDSYSYRLMSDGKGGPKKSEIVFYVTGDNIVVKTQGTDAFSIPKNDPIYAIIIAASKVEAFTAEEEQQLSQSTLLSSHTPSIGSVFLIPYCALHPQCWEVSMVEDYKNNLFTNFAKTSLGDDRAFQLKEGVIFLKEHAKKFFEERIPKIKISSQEVGEKLKILQQVKQNPNLPSTQANLVFIRLLNLKSDEPMLSNENSFKEQNTKPKKEITDTELNSAYIRFVLVNAYVYCAFGGALKSKEVLERALKIFEQLYGTKHVEVANALVHLGNAYGDLGDALKSKELLERALTIFERFYGPEHIDEHAEVAKTLANLGAAYYALGDTPKTIELLERALTIFKRLYGPEHIEVTTVLDDLDKVYGDLENAKVQEISHFLDEEKSQGVTAAYFKGMASSEWKPYPESRLVGNYIGHKVLSKVIYVPQGRSARFIRRVTPTYDISGLYTDGFSSCQIILCIGEENIALMHIDMQVNPERVREEISWVGHSSEIVVIYRRKSGEATRQAIFERFKDLRLIFKTMDDEHDGVFVSFLDQSENDIHPKIRKYERGALPQEPLLRHPQEEKFLAVQKIEQIIGMRAKSVTLTIRDKVLCIFDGSVWEPIPDEELRLDVSNGMTQEEVKFFAPGMPYIEVAGRLGGILQKARKTFTITVNDKEFIMPIAVYLESYLNDYNYTYLFKIDLLNIIENHPTQGEKSSKVDRSLKEKISRILQAEHDVFEEIAVVMRDYDRQAPKTSCKDDILDEYRTICRHYYERKKYGDLSRGYQENRESASRFLILGKEKFDKQEYEASAECFCRAIVQLTIFSLKNTPELARAYYDCGRSLYLAKRHEFALSYLNNAYVLLKEYLNWTPPMLKQLEEYIADCKDQLSRAAVPLVAQHGVFFGSTPQPFLAPEAPSFFMPEIPDLITEMNIALVKYAKDGNIAKVKECIDGGADVNAKYGNNTALLSAIAEKHIDVVCYLLTVDGIEANLTNKELKELLAIARIDGNLRIRLNKIFDKASPVTCIDLCAYEHGKRLDVHKEDLPVLLQICEAIPTLKSLAIFGSELDEEDSIMLAKSILKMQQLETFKLYDSNIGDPGVSRIADIIGKHSGIRCFGFCSNTMSNIAADTIAKAVANNTNITTLSIKGKNINNEGIVSLLNLSSLNRLEQLVITGGTVDSIMCREVANRLAKDNRLKTFVLEAEIIDDIDVVLDGIRINSFLTDVMLIARNLHPSKVSVIETELESIKLRNVQGIYQRKIDDILAFARETFGLQTHMLDKVFSEKFKTMLPTYSVSPIPFFGKETMVKAPVVEKSSTLGLSVNSKS